jgi:hypothetical protein
MVCHDLLLLGWARNMGSKFLTGMKFGGEKIKISSESK